MIAMSLSKNAQFLLKERYCKKGETPLQVFDRVAEALCLGDKRFGKHLCDAMKGGYFLPASPTLRNAGFKKTLLHPCHCLPIEDSMESIMRCLSECALIFHFGGGVGFNISKLRPKGANLSTGGISSGLVSFLGLFDALTEIVRQGAFRRGALMCVLDYNHPEIIPFITSKLTGKLTNFNVSVMVTNEFMEKVKTEEKIDLEFNGVVWGTIKAKDLFDQIVFSAHCCGDPGLLFFDRINKDNKLYPNVIIKAANPCSETPLPEYCCCNLGAINLSKFVKKDGSFDTKRFSDYVSLGIRTLKNINAVGWFPFSEMTKQMKLLDPCGLGFFGLADALIMAGIPYDSDETLKFLDDISKPYVEITNEIAKDSFYKRSQQPTGSLSIIADCSAGIEPVFEKRIRKHLSFGVLEEVRELYKSKYCRTAYEISPEWHLKIQAKVQSFVDSGVSKTVNLPFDASIDTIRDVYFKSWEMGCKGVTVFRQGCKEGVIESLKCNGVECNL